MFKKLLVIVLSVAALSGCAVKPYHRPMQPAAKEKIESVKVLIVSQSKGVAGTFFYQSSQGAAAQFGLLGALISAGVDSMMNKSEVDATKIGINRLAGFYDRPEMEKLWKEKLETEFSSVDWLQGQQLQFVDTKKSVLAVLREPDTDALIVVETYYQFVPMFQGMKGLAHVSLYRKSAIPELNSGTVSRKKLEFEDKAQFRNRYAYQSKLLPVPSRNSDEVKTQQEVIRAKYAAESKGQALSRDKQKQMNKEIAALNGRFDFSDTAAYNVKHWEKSDGEMMATELKTIVDNLSAYVGQDLRGQFQEVKGERLVERTKAGYEVGAILSRASGDTFPVWNTAQFAEE